MNNQPILKLLIMMKIDNKLELILKSIAVYLVMLLLMIIVMRTYAGGGKGIIGAHYQMSWDTIWSTFYIFLIGALFISYPFLSLFYKEYKKKKKTR